MKVLFNIVGSAHVNINFISRKTETHCLCQCIQ